MTSVSYQSADEGILGNGWNVLREGVPVLPGTLLHRPRPERVTSSPSEETLKPLDNLQKGGRLEPHRADTRLTAYTAVSTPNGSRVLSRRLAAPTRLELVSACAITNRVLYPFELRGRWLWLSAKNRAHRCPAEAVRVAAILDKRRTPSVRNRGRREHGHFLV